MKFSVSFFLLKISQKFLGTLGMFTYQKNKKEVEGGRQIMVNI